MMRDVAIIGAGPVGLFAVFACGQLGMTCAVVDALADPGGQLTALYPEKPIYDIPGRPAVRADALVADLLAQAAPYAPHYHLGVSATALSQDGNGHFRITLSSGETLAAKAVILAAGAGAFGPNRPPLDGIEAFEGVSVFYHVAKRDRFAGKRIVIAGGGDSAVDWALSLADVAAHVTVVHRREAFRAHPANVAAMGSHDTITVMTPYQLTALHGAGSALQAVDIARVGGGTTRLEADALIALYGLASDLSLLADWGLLIDGKRIPVAAATTATARDGVYAIGDVATYPGKLDLILTGFAEAAVAAHEAYARVFPGKPLRSEYSTTRGVPGLATATAA
ncbi:MAG: NAD(P)/FAD-dependent oxidoreductase [Pseudomonadota bacterium]